MGLIIIMRFRDVRRKCIEPRTSMFKEKVKLTNMLGFDVDQAALDALSDNGVYTGEMFGEVLLNDQRYNENSFIKPYRSGGERSDNPYVNFYWDFYAQGKPCYTEIVYPTLKRND